jgi:hypothetical protein
MINSVQTAIDSINKGASTAEKLYRICGLNYERIRQGEDNKEVVYCLIHLMTILPLICLDDIPSAWHEDLVQMKNASKQLMAEVERVHI